jgi:hypothetical protein
VTRRVTIRNISTFTYEYHALDAISSSDPQLAAALVGGALPLQLWAGEEAQVDVTFTPTDHVRTTGAITFDADAGDDPTLAFVGDGVFVSATVAPAAVDFGTIDASGTPAQRLALRNTGDRPLTVSGASIDLPGDFKLTGLPGGTTLAPGESRGFRLRATPTSLGRRRATLAIDLDSIADLTVPVDVLVRDPDLRVRTLDATPDDYEVELGAVPIPGGAKIAKVELHNMRASPVAIAGCSIAGDPGFSVASPCPFTIPAHGSVQLAIAFAPSAAAASAATLILISSCLPTGVLQLGLRGTGVAPGVPSSARAVAPARARGGVEVGARSLDLGAVATGTTLRLSDLLEGALAVRNLDDAIDHAVTAAILSDSPAFRLIELDRPALSPGERAALDVELVAAAPGRYEATIAVFVDGDPEPRAQVRIAALAVDAGPAAAPAAGGCGASQPASSLALGGALLIGLCRRRRRARGAVAARLRSA